MKHSVLMLTGLLSLVVTPALAGDDHERISPEALHMLQQNDGAPLVLDVRSREEVQEEGRVPGAVVVPHDEMPERLDELAGHEDETVVLYCASNRRAGIAAETMEEHGFEQISFLEGAFPGWRDAGKPVEEVSSEPTP